MRRRVEERDEEGDEGEDEFLDSIKIIIGRNLLAMNPHPPGHVSIPAEPNQ